MTPEQAVSHAHQLAAVGRLADAEKLCQQVLTRAPANHQAIELLFQLKTTLGREHASRGEMAEAEARLLEAVRLKPQDATGLANMGALRILQRRHEEAVGFLSRALELNPRLIDAISNLGLAHMTLGDLDAAEAAYRKAVALAPMAADGMMIMTAQAPV